MKLPGIVFFLFLGAGILHAADKRLNLVLIIADDMAWDDCGIYGNPNIPTPRHRPYRSRGDALRSGFPYD